MQSAPGASVTYTLTAGLAQNYNDSGTMEELRSKSMEELVEVLQQHTLGPEGVEDGGGGASADGSRAWPHAGEGDGTSAAAGAAAVGAAGQGMPADLVAAAAAVPYSSVAYSPVEPEHRFIGVSHDSRARTWRPLLMLRLRRQGEERKNGNPTRALAGCKTAEEGACAHDLAVLWRSLHHEDDYGALESQKLNFSLSRWVLGVFFWG